MAKKQSARAAARKMKDKWKAKEWYKVMAPGMFNNAQIAETLSDEPHKLMGRVAEVTVQDITGDFSKMHIKLRFKVGDIVGYNAHTFFIGHNLTSDYIRRLTRRKHSKTDGTFDVRTKDNYLVRLKPMAVTERRIQGSQQKAIRMVMADIIEKEAKRFTLGELVKSMISGDLPKTISKECKHVYPLKRVEIRKSEILDMPSGGKEQMEIVEQPKEEVEEAPPADVATEEGEANAEEKAEAEETAEEEKAEEEISEEEAPVEETSEEKAEEELTEEEIPKEE